MKKMIKLALVSLAVVALPFAINGTIGSQAKGQGQSAEIDPNRPSQEKIDAKKQEIQDKKDEINSRKEEALEEKCKNVETRIDTQVQRFQVNQQNRKNAYEQIENKIENLISNLKKQGVETTDLEEAFGRFKEQLQTFYAEHERVMNQLQTTKQYACGESQGQFKDELQKARQQLKIAHRERLELRNQFVSELRPALLQLRSEIQNQNQVDQLNNSEDETTEL
ncbi:MAG: hypothetical protein PHQ20_03855 [Candidatus Moranbacteria bacterium]|jgi:DNA repair exonuclease SbcCD ATPase subunit|nr:hypothetical protein [Candidatus Moranbacteria bacterium]